MMSEWRNDHLKVTLALQAQHCFLVLWLVWEKLSQWLIAAAARVAHIKHVSLRHTYQNRVGDTTHTHTHMCRHTSTASFHNGGGSSNKNRMQLQTGSWNASKTPPLAAEEVNGNPGNQVTPILLPPHSHSAPATPTYKQTLTRTHTRALAETNASFVPETGKITNFRQPNTNTCRVWEEMSGQSESRTVRACCLCPVYIAHNLSPFARWMLLWADCHYKAIHAHCRDTDIPLHTPTWEYSMSRLQHAWRIYSFAYQINMIDWPAP